MTWSMMIWAAEVSALCYKKHVTTSSTISWTRIVRLQKKLAHVVQDYRSLTGVFISSAHLLNLYIVRECQLVLFLCGSYGNGDVFRHRSAGPTLPFVAKLRQYSRHFQKDCVCLCVHRALSKIHTTGIAVLNAQDLAQKVYLVVFNWVFAILPPTPR